MDNIINKSSYILFLLFSCFPILVSILACIKLEDSKNCIILVISTISFLSAILLLFLPFYLIGICNYFTRQRGVSLLLCIPICIIVNILCIIIQWLRWFKPVIFNKLINAEFPNTDSSTMLIQNIWFGVSLCVLIIGLVVVTLLKLFTK